jgi:hypothetical protein
MAFKKTISIVICLMLFIQIAKAITWKTVNNGNWNAGGVWQGGIAPPSSSADTFLIRNNINISNNLTFNSNAVLQIDSIGGLCGHYKVTVNAGAKIIKYGTLNFDVIDIPGGLVNCYKPGAVIITQYGVLTNGGQLNTFGCPFNVGPWFTCQFPSDNAIETFIPLVFNLYPNPSNGIFVVETNTFVNVTVQLYDVTGKMLFNKIINNKASIDVGSLNDGVYNLSVSNNNSTVNKRVVVIK